MKEKKNNSVQIKRIIDFLEIKKSTILLFILLVTSVTILGSAGPLMFGYLIDSINNVPRLTLFIIAIFVVNLLGNILNYAMQRMQFSIIKDIECNVKRKIFTNILSIDYEEYIKMEKGRFVNTLQKDAEIFTKIFIMVVSIVIDLSSALIVSIIMFKIDGLLTLIFLLAFPLNIYIFGRIGKKIRVKTKEGKSSIDRFLTLINELLMNFKTLKVYHSMNFVISKVNYNIKDTYQILDDRNILSSRSTFITQVINTLLNVVIITLGINHIKNGALSVGGLVSFNTYSVSLNKSLLRLSQLNADVQEIFISVNRIESLMNTSKDEQITGITENFENCFKKEIKINHLSFKFDDNTIIFDDVNILIRPCSFVTFLGMNGTGKTTLFNLLSKLYETYDGNIIFGDTNIKQIPRTTISKKICYVFHENIITSLTIKENFLLANPNAEEECIITACKNAYLWNFIDELPDKLETKLDEINLSEGQKQKLNIARALISNADIYLLDEITSSLDTISEKGICGLFKELKKTKTILNISHRKELLKITDMIYEIREHKITADMGIK